MFGRVIIISLALLIGIVVIIPLATNYTEASAPKPENHKKKYKKYKKYSKKWWRAYYNRVRQQRVIQSRRRILRLRRIRFANAGKVSPQLTNQKIASAIQTNNLFILVEGKIKKVFDGKTFNVENKDGIVYLVRMLGVDAPNMNQDFGDKSQKNLSDLILGKDATVIIRKSDSAGRYIGTVYCGGEDINRKQIETGMAWYFQRNGYEPMEDDRKIYEQAERKAHIKRNGLWGKQKNNNVMAFKQ